MTRNGFLLIVALVVLLGGALYLTPALAAQPYQVFIPTSVPCNPNPFPDPSVSLSVSPTTQEVGQTIKVTMSSQEITGPQYTLYAGGDRIAKFSSLHGIEVYNESPILRIVAGAAPSNWWDQLAVAELEAYAPGTTDLSVMTRGNILSIITGRGTTCTGAYYTGTTEYSNTVPVSITDSSQVFNPSVYYKIVNKATGLVLDSGGQTVGGSYAKLWIDVPHDNLRWQIIDTGGGWYKIVNKATGLVLDSGGQTVGGSYAKLWIDIEHDNLRWQIIGTGGGWYKIVNKATGLVLDSGGQTVGGGYAKLWWDIEHDNLRWQIIEAD